MRAATQVTSPPTPIDPIQHIQGEADDRNRLTVEAMVNGQGPFHFVVDTGADRSVVSDDLAKALALPAASDMIVEGIARSIPAPAVRLEKLQVDWLEMNDLALPTLPRAWLGGDGYLGLDVVDHQAVTFDFLNHRLSIAPSDRLPEMRGWVSNHNLARITGGHGKVTAVDCNVDGARASAFVDSGAQISIGNLALFNALAKQGATYIDNVAIELLGVTGGSVQGRLTAIQDIKMGTVTFSNSALVIADLPIFRLWNLQDRPALFIGMNFLRQLSAVTIDYGRKELRLKLADGDMRLARRA